MVSAQIIEPDWPVPSHVRSLSTTRIGGVSAAPYDSLNIADHVGDEPRRVRQNRQILSKHLQLPSRPVWLDQQHTRNVICLNNVTNDELPSDPFDAAWTSQPGQICVVMTADCLPVLICDEAGTRVAAVHAGWRGLAMGVIEEAVKALIPARGRLYAWLGPAIGPAAYEIDQAVRAQLITGNPGSESAFQVTRPGHWTVDLYALARLRLTSCGVNDIFGGTDCTYSDSSRFFSYRRDGICGRMASMIWLTE